MLRQVYLILNDEIICQYNYAKGLDNSSFLNLYPNIKKVAFSKFGVEFGTYEFFEYKLSYLVEKSLNEILPKYIADEALINIEETLETKESTEMKFVLPYKDSQMIFRMNIIPIGKSEVLAFLQNITRMW